MQTLTYVVGKDKRDLVKDIQNFEINFKNDSHNWVQARQYENSMRQVFVNVENEDGSPFDLTGANAVYEGVLPDKVHKIYDARHAVMIDPVNGQFRFDFPKQAFAVAGSYVQAFFRIMRDGDSVTTLEFDMTVLADKVISGLIPADYITPFEDLYDQLEDIVANAKGDLTTALADWTTKLSDLFSRLNSQGQDTATMLTTIEQKIKADNLFTQANFEIAQKQIDDAIAQLDPTTQAVENVDNLTVAVDGGVQEPFTTALSSFKSTINTDPAVAKVGLLQDLHYQRAIYQDEYGEATSRGLVHIQQMAVLKDKLGLVVYNGDNVHGRESKTSTVKRIKQLVNTSAMAFGETPTLWTIGNHDDNNVYFNGALERPNTLTLSEIKDAFEMNQTYGYHDLPGQKVRVIVMDAFENPEIYNYDGSIKYDRSYNSIFSGTQLNWIASTLLGTPKGYSVIAFMHCPPVGFDGNLPYDKYQDINHDLMLGLYRAFISGESYSGIGTNADYPATVTADFTSRGQGNFVGIVAGHEHHDLAPQVHNGIRVIERTCSLGSGTGRVLGDVNEEAFDVIEIDTADNHVKFNRFGAGSSLEFDY